MPRITKSINPKLISSLVMMIIIAALLVATTFAWFSNNTTVGAGGMSVTVTDKRVTLGDTITVTRTLSSSTVYVYKCEGEDPYYYLYSDGAFETDEDGNRIPFSISELLPGETVDVTFSYTCTDSLIGSPIKASLSSIESDTFTEVDNADADHSVLGVYKYSVMQNGAFGEDSWVVEYTPGVDDVVPSSLPLFEGAIWQKVSDTPADNYVEITFRFDFDLEQYYTLKTATNQLSEKSFSINELRIEVE